jgi:hypothetical protein
MGGGYDIDTERAPITVFGTKPSGYGWAAHAFNPGSTGNPPF